MGDLHILLIPTPQRAPTGYEFVERYAEHLRQRIPPASGSGVDAGILWWAPEKAFCRALSNPYLFQSSDGNEQAVWAAIRNNTLPTYFVNGVIVIDNELLLTTNPRDLINQLRNDALSTQATLIVPFPSDDHDAWRQRFLHLVTAAHTVISAANERHGRYIKNRGRQAGEVIHL